jgi:ATP-dependent RNA helicase RhlE
MNQRSHKGPRRRGSEGRRSAGPRRENIAELRPNADVPKIESFEEWDLGEEVQRAIRTMDISVPTPIQALSIGPVLEGKDVIAKAETGTGKTLAFGAPMMARVDPARSTVLGLVLSPTRELAQQVANVLQALGLPRGIQIALVVGGDPLQPQIAALQGGAQIVVGTPGRILDLYQQRFLSFPWTEFVVLDEADKMFEIGFLDDIKKILSYMPDERQTLLFSATFPTEVLKLARSHTKEPIEVATALGTATVDLITQCWIDVPEEDRALTLIRLIEQSSPRDIFLVFCERRTDVDRLFRRLERLPSMIKALHGGYDQAARFRVMSAFRTGDVKALIATDVASRGLDVLHVTHVVNFSVPRDFEDYTHRIGRTGRAGRTGTAITFVTGLDRRRWSDIQRRSKPLIEEIPLPGWKSTGNRPERSGGHRPERTRPERGRRQEERRPRRDRQTSQEERPPREEQPARAERTRRERPDPRRSGGDSRKDAPARDRTSSGEERQRRGRDRKKEQAPKRPATKPREDQTTAKAPAAPGRLPFGFVPEDAEAPAPQKGRPRRSNRGRAKPGSRKQDSPSKGEERVKPGGFGAGL